MVIVVLATAAFALFVARAMRAPRATSRYIVGLTIAVLASSQLLAEGHPFRAQAAAFARLCFWVGLGLVPVGLYAAWLRSLRRRTGIDAELPPSRPRGLVLFDDDFALTGESVAALAAEAPGKRLSLGWRGADAELEGHVRLRILGDLAEVELLRVVPEAQRRGVGGALLRAAEGEAIARGARRIGAVVGDWQAPDFFVQAGYSAAAEAVAPRRWMEKML